MLVGDFWTPDDEKARLPFTGTTGYTLTKMLEEAGIRRVDCYLTNVFNLNPGGDIDKICCPKKEDRSGLPPVKLGKYVRAEFLPELERLAKEIAEVKPNLIIALGSTASWALLHNATISKIRGTIALSVFPEGVKVLPAYHPGAILRQWELRHVTVLDLMKASREAEYPEVRRPERTVWIEPTLTDLDLWYDELSKAEIISFDIETAADAITCIGFSHRPDVAMVIPFTDERKAGGSYWSTAQDERKAWNIVRAILRTPIPKVAQNGLYDVHFLWRRYGIPVVNFEHDTMLLHHSLQPEAKKGLGFLGSVYTNESSWKIMRSRGKTTIKKDE